MKRLLVTAFLLAIIKLSYGQIDSKGQSLTQGPVFTKVEQMPEFPGGNDSLMAYIGSHMVYPKAAIDDNIYGKVFVTFVVDNTGMVKDVKVMRGVREDLDNEALRVVQSLPIWEPGMQNGKKVNVQYTLPIVYQLPEKK